MFLSKPENYWQQTIFPSLVPLILSSHSSFAFACRFLFFRENVSPTDVQQFVLQISSLILAKCSKLHSSCRCSICIHSRRHTYQKKICKYTCVGYYFHSSECPIRTASALTWAKFIHFFLTSAASRNRSRVLPGQSPTARHGPHRHGPAGHWTGWTNKTLGPMGSLSMSDSKKWFAH